MLSKKIVIILSIIIIINTLLDIFTFSPLIKFFSSEHPVSLDYSILTYQSMNARIFFAKNYQMWGYDPYFMAGYPVTFIWNSNVAVQVFSCIFSFLSMGIILKSFIFLTIATMPLTLYLTFRNFEFPPDTSIIGVVMGIIYFRIGLPIIFTISGMITTSLLLHFSLYVFSIFYQQMKRKNVKFYHLFFGAPLVLLIHKTATVILSIPILLLFLVYRKNLPKSFYIFMLLLILFILIINSFWLQPIYEFRTYKTFLNYAPFWQNYNLMKPFEDYFNADITIHKKNPFGTNAYGWPIINNFLLWFGIAGIFLLIKSKEKIGIVFLGSCIFFFILSYFGSFWNLTATLNPYRYTSNLNYFLLIPATFSLNSFFRFIQKKFSLKKYKIVLTFFFSLALFLYFSNPVFIVTLILRLMGEPIILLKSLDKPLIQLVNWIDNYPLDNGRILFEGSGQWDREGSGNQYYQTYPICFFHILTKKQFIGGPYPYVFEKFNFANFHGGLLFERNIESLSSEELKEYFDLYNILLIISWSKISRNYFEEFKGYTKKIKVIDKYTIYEVKQKPSFFYKGAGTIKVDFNNLLLANLTPTDNEIVIKYHWAPTLKSNPPLNIEKVFLLDDPIGFIKIKNPPKTIKIYNF